MLEKSEPAMTVWFRLLRRRLDLKQAVHLEAAARECAGMLDGVQSPLRREALLQEMALHLGVPPQSLVRLLRAQAAPRTEAPAAPVAAAAPLKLTPLQRADLELLACVLAQPFLAQETETLAVELPAAAELLALCREGVQQGRTVRDNLVRFLFTSCAERSDLRTPLGVAAERSAHIPDPRAFWEALQQGRARATADRAAKTTRQLYQEAVAAGDRARADELTLQLVAERKAGRPRGPAPGQAGAAPNQSATPPSPGHS
jgi:hypothetical protein